jgi:type IV pilus biogenesis protein CpaD/CtpE
MKTTFSDIAFVFMGFAVLIGLCGCDMYHETYMSPNRMQVEKGTFFEQISADQVNSAYLEEIARGYDKSGQGPLDVTVTYDPVSKTNTAMKASNKASGIARTLQQNGVADIDVSILPVHAQGGISDVLLSYNAYEAKGPRDCENQMQGMTTTSVEATPDYRLGCTMGAVMAKQIARPKDLAGTPTKDPVTDGRRSSNIIERFRTGTPNKPLEGQAATDDK